MTGICLIMVFLFCAAAGYIAVSRGAEFLEQVLFQNSEVCYTVREDSRACVRLRGAELLKKRRPGRKTEGHKVRSGA